MLLHDPTAENYGHATGAAHTHAPAPHENGAAGRTRPSEFDPRTLGEELMNALVVEDSPLEFL